MEYRVRRAAVCMSTVKFTQTMVNSITPGEKRQRIKDSVIRGLTLSVEPSGRKTWLIDYYRPDKKRTYYTIGSSDIFTVTEAREVAKGFLAQVALGHDPAAKPEPRDSPITLRGIIEYYEPWVLANRKRGDYSLDALRRIFGSLLDLPVENLKIIDVETLRDERTRAGIKASSINRQTSVLKTVLNWAVKRELIKFNPLERLERLQERDSHAKVRYLLPEERARLMAALDAREARMRAERANHNKWLAERKQKQLPEITGRVYADHLKPMILISLNTGIRRGSLFGLRWGDVDLVRSSLTLRAEEAKSGKVNHVPLNSIAHEALSIWRAQSAAAAEQSLVFPSPRGGGKMDNCNSAWESLLKAAEIENFRWHDMRHDFASQLVMKGVDLNTVRELLGHADLKMTLRYAHLAPEAKVQAVGVLVNPK